MLKITRVLQWFMPFHSYLLIIIQRIMFFHPQRNSIQKNKLKSNNSFENFNHFHPASFQVFQEIRLSNTNKTKKFICFLQHLYDLFSVFSCSFE